MLWPSISAHRAPIAPRSALVPSGGSVASCVHECTNAQLCETASRLRGRQRRRPGSSKSARAGLVGTPPPPPALWARPSTWALVAAIVGGLVAWRLSRRRQGQRSPSIVTIRSLEASLVAVPPKQNVEAEAPPAVSLPVADSTPSTAAAAATDTAVATVTAQPPADLEIAVATSSPAESTAPPQPGVDQDEFVPDEILLTDGCKVLVLADGDALAAAVVSETAAAARSAIAEKGAFSMAVCGGAVAHALRDLSKEKDLDFKKFHVFFCHDTVGQFPVYKEACELWLNACRVPESQIHKLPDIPGEGGAATYTATICMQDEEVIGDSAEGLPAVDLALLSTDDDGGCGGVRASSAGVDEAGSGQVVLFSEEVSAELALSVDFMSAAQHAILLAGKGAINLALAGDDAEGTKSPAAMVRAPKTTWLTTRSSMADYGTAPSP